MFCFMKARRNKKKRLTGIEGVRIVLLEIKRGRASHVGTRSIVTNQSSWILTAAPAGVQRDRCTFYDVVMRRLLNKPCDFKRFSLIDMRRRGLNVYYIVIDQSLFKLSTNVDNLKNGHVCVYCMIQI